MDLKNEARERLFAELLQPTAWGVERLLSAWEGLSPETQAEVLLAIRTRNHDPSSDPLGRAFPHYLAEKVRVTALNSTNAFVRHLAARAIELDDDDGRTGGGDEAGPLHRMISEDPAPVVRHARRRFEYMGGPSPEEFWSLEHIERLAMFQGSDVIEGVGADRFVELLSFAVEELLPSDGVSALEVFEVCWEYVSSELFKWSYLSERTRLAGLDMYDDGKAIEGLWRIAARPPPFAAGPLIDKLPEACGLSGGIPAEILDDLHPGLLERLLNRSDVSLARFRKRKYLAAPRWKYASTAGDPIAQAAMSFNFDLTDKEFLAILGEEAKRRANSLTDLAIHAKDLSLYVYEALIDAIRRNDEAMFEAGVWAEQSRDHRLKRLTEVYDESEDYNLRDGQLRLLGIYDLAREAVPWDGSEGYGPYDEWEFLAGDIVAGDTWRTFIAMRESCNQMSSDAKRWMLVQRGGQLLGLSIPDNPEYEDSSVEDEAPQPLMAVAEAVQGLRAQISGLWVGIWILAAVSFVLWLLR